MKIHTVYQATRKKPFIARWYEERRQRNRFFSTEAARAAFIEQFQKTAQRQDPVLPTIAPHQLIRWQQAMAIAPDADPVEVFKFWKAEHRKIAKLGERYLHYALNLSPFMQVSTARFSANTGFWRRLFPMQCITGSRRTGYVFSGFLIVDLSHPLTSRVWRRNPGFYDIHRLGSFSEWNRDVDLYKSFRHSASHASAPDPSSKHACRLDEPSPADGHRIFNGGEQGSQGAPWRQIPVGDPQAVENQAEIVRTGRLGDMLNFYQKRAA